MEEGGLIQNRRLKTHRRSGWGEEGRGWIEIADCKTQGRVDEERRAERKGRLKSQIENAGVDGMERENWREGRVEIAD